LLEKSIFFVITLLTNKRNYDIIDLLLVEAHFAISIPSCKRLSKAERGKGADAEVGSRNRAGLAMGNKIPFVVAAMRRAIQRTEHSGAEIP